MQIRKTILLWFMASCLLASPATHAQQVKNIVSLGGSVSEIIYELGFLDSLIAIDDSSYYPPTLKDLPSVGYYRSLSLEGLISLQPDVILASEKSGPPQVLKRVADLGINVQQISDASSIESLYLRIKQIADILAVPDRGEVLTQEIRKNLKTAQTITNNKLKALVLLNRTGQFMAAGNDTTANEILKLAGLENALANKSGYKTISTEGIAAIAPELIIITSGSLGDASIKEFMAQPGIANTPAAKANRIIAIDDLLILGLGPRTPQAIASLKKTSQ